MPNQNSKKLKKAVHKLQRGYHAQSFRHIYDNFSPKLFYICLRYMKDEAAAKDALQEVFVIVFEKIKSFKDAGNFEGWLRRITVHHCIYLLKKQKIRLEFKDDYLPPVEQINFDHALEEQQLKEKLKRAIQQLPDGFRTIVNLYIIEDYSHKEIAAMLDISEGTSRSQLNRAKIALRKHFEEKE